MIRLRFYIGQLDKQGISVPWARFDAVEDLLKDTFEGFTVYSAEGVWKGKGEPTRVYEILTSYKHTGRGIASKCAEICNQDTVLLTTEEVEEVYLCTP